MSDLDADRDKSTMSDVKDKASSSTTHGINDLASENEDLKTEIWGKADLFRSEEAESKAKTSSPFKCSLESVDSSESEGLDDPTEVDPTLRTKVEAKPSEATEEEERQTDVDAPLEIESRLSSAKITSEAKEKEPEATPQIYVQTKKESQTKECRMCGKHVKYPMLRRFRGSEDSDIGFICDRCENTFCAAHVIRVSSLFESLFKRGRFRCVLCNMEKTK